jgi:stage II sporulation protein R
LISLKKGGINLLKIEKAILCGFIIVVIATFSSGFSAFANSCDEIRGKVFRLHILANSDSSEDQALKLKVRDRILSASSEIFTSSGDKAQALLVVKNNLDKIESIAQDEVNKQGYIYPVKATVVNMYFTTRTYGSVTLPAGDYDALRITIGKAEGHNWWCVLFPPLCLPSAKSSENLDDVLGSKEANSIQNSSSGYVIKFKCVEIFQQAKNAVSNFFSRPKKASSAKTTSSTNSTSSSKTTSSVEPIKPRTEILDYSSMW